VLLFGDEFDDGCLVLLLSCFVMEEGGVVNLFNCGTSIGAEMMEPSNRIV
jgi:hypothetical protein